MRSGWLAVGLVLLGAARLPAQSLPSLSQFEMPCATGECDRPRELPPLLSVPSPMPPSPGSHGPAGEYDPGYFYLPERAPENDGPAACGPAGRFWISPALELAWIKPVSAPNLVRVGTLTGPVAYGGLDLAPAQAGSS